MRRQNVYKPYISLIIALLIGSFCYIAHKKSGEHGQTDWVTQAVRQCVVLPSTRLSDRMRCYFEHYFVPPRKANELILENERLRQENSQLTFENHLFQEQTLENARLRKMLQLPPPRQFNHFAATLAALKPSTIRDSAIARFAPGIHGAPRDVAIDSSGNLVGQITTASGESADILLVTDQSFSAGAKVVAIGRSQPTKSVVGICQGARSGVMNLTDAPIESDILIGDSVETSGLGSVFPPGIPIGTVIAVHSDLSRSFKTATIRCSANIDDLREVYLLR